MVDWFIAPLGLGVKEFCYTVPMSLLVTGYVDPDLDGVACAMAYADFLTRTGRPAVAGIIGAPHIEAQWVLDMLKIPASLLLDDAHGYDETILVDASDTRGLHEKIPLEKVVEIVDHRKMHEAAKFPRAKLQIEMVGAAATLIAEKFHAAGLKPSAAMATLLYGGIISNTLNFRAQVVTDRDRQMAAWLLEIAKLPDDFIEKMFAAKSDLSGDQLAKTMAGELAWFTFGGKITGVVQLEITSAINLLADRLKDVRAVLDKLRQERQLDTAFVTIIALDEGCNYFVALDATAEEVIKRGLDVVFHDGVARREGFIMRKEISVLLW